MKVENDKIVEATEHELYKYWLDHDWDILFSFDEYLRRMKDRGVKIIMKNKGVKIIDNK